MRAIWSYRPTSHRNHPAQPTTAIRLHASSLFTTEMDYYQQELIR